MQRFEKVISPTTTSRILDVGGTSFNWKYLDYKFRVTILNICTPGTLSIPNNCEYVQGDGTELGFMDGEYDIVFSNSVIEHLETYERQRKFAHEIRRVGKKIWLQTPAKSFFVEPHLITPFIHYLPINIQRKLLRNFTLRGLLTRPSKEEIERFISEVRMLSYEELKSLFPDCVIEVERFLGMSKSYLVIRT